MRSTEIQYFSDPTPHRDKERLYAELRRREGRWLSDEAVRQLPHATGPLAAEWRLRRRSFGRFQAYCRQMAARKGNASFRILDLGCGNGWMSNLLAENPAWELWAVDVNEAELAQGARLFGRDNLHFVYADIASGKDIPGTMPGTSSGAFDLIVLAASVQYFPDLQALLDVLRTGLNPDGEIHLIDAPFYASETERAAARRRTADYYARTGVPAMTAHYHHHLWPEIQALGGLDMNKSLKIRFLQKIKWLAPFPWVRLQSR